VIGNESNGHSRYADDVAPWLLGALPEEERRAFERHLAGCGRCREEVAALRPAVEALPLASPPVPAPRALHERIMRTVESEAELLQAAGEGADRPAREDRRRRPLFGSLRPALVAGLAAAAVAIGVLGYLIGQEAEPGAREVAANVTFPSAAATVRTQGGQAELKLTNMPPPPHGKVYEVWLRRGGQSPRPTTALFVVRSGSVSIPGGLKGASQVLVTAEPAGGSLVPTSKPVIVANTA
jgi:anti-sigma-K factor RskA